MKSLYICDPEKNKECKKTLCQTDCFLTTKKEYEKKLSPPGISRRATQEQTKEFMLLGGEK